PELFVHIPGKDQNVLLKSSKAINTLGDLGIQVSTGPVVDFRMKTQLYKRRVEGAVPLIYPVNFEAEGLNWPKPNKKNHLIAVNKDTSNSLFPAGYYTLVKRFTSKEESRRVVSRVI